MERRVTRRGSRTLLVLLVLALVGLRLHPLSAQSAGSPELPLLTAPVNDFAHVVDPASAAAIEQVIRALQTATGDVLVVATIPTVEPYANVDEYAVKLFENHGRGIGERAKDNGLLILVAVAEKRVRFEVGYGLEQWITDGFAGETIRDYLAPEFREGRYGPGLLAGTSRVAGRIAQGRNVSLTGVDIPQELRPSSRPQLSLTWIILIFVLIAILSRIGGGPGRGVRRWGRRGWSGWSSGVGPFGGGFGGGWGGGGFGGGFGGLGGGRSGGGGASGGW
jgi:uncharacterized protein